MHTTRLAKLCTELLIVLACAVLANRAYSASESNSKSPNRPAAQNRQVSRPARGINKNAPGPSSFRADMPLSEAIDILRNSTEPPLNITVLWRDLEQNADIYKTTPIGIDGVSGVPLRTHLKLLLLSLSSNSPENLGYVVDDGIIIIATENSLPRRLRTRIYYIADLVAGLP